MAKTILSKNQKKVLSALSDNDFLKANFYLSGGTALSEYHLHHRLSEDLDFFSENEFDPNQVFIFFKQVSKKLGIQRIDYKQSFNRNLFFLFFDDDLVKTEFAYFPFPRIEKLKNNDRFEIDSLFDIAVNKIFTIYQKPRSRDFIDLYSIIKKTKWTISDLIKQARIKFDWHIDLIQLGSKFMLASDIADYPKMLKKINHKDWKTFFLKESKKIGKDILK